MATLNVPGDYPTITAAVAAASPGDTISVAAAYGGNETVTVTVNNLTFEGPASVTGIVLNADGIVSAITLAGDSPIAVNGTASDETIIGNAGDNLIVSGGGNDTLSGGDGSDRVQLFGGATASGTVNGGAGHDVINSDDLGGYVFEEVETLHVGRLHATLEQISAFANIVDTAPLEPITIALRGAGGTIDFTDRITGTDRLSVYDGGMTGGYTVTGSIYEDHLDGTAFDDTLNGGDGDDWFGDRGGGDFDTLNGENGHDFFFIMGGETASGTVDGGVGEDMVEAIDLGGYDFLNVEILALNSGQVGATIEQLSAFDSLYDFNSDYTQFVINLRGAGGTIDFNEMVTGDYSIAVYDDGVTAGYSVKGSVNSDYLSGSRFSDTLNGRGGVDTVSGFGGHDTYYVDKAGDRVFEAASAGSDLVRANVSYALEAGQSIETLATFTNTGTAAIALTGNDLVQRVLGNEGANILNGKGGSDTLTGLGGADTFVFDTALGADNLDRITDFDVPTDTIRLDDGVFSALGTGALDAAAFKDVGTGTADADDRILYDSGTGALFYDANGSGAGGRVQFALLDTKPASLSAADFVIV